MEAIQGFGFLPGVAKSDMTLSPHGSRGACLRFLPVEPWTRTGLGFIRRTCGTARTFHHRNTSRQRLALRLETTAKLHSLEPPDTTGAAARLGAAMVGTARRTAQLPAEQDLRESGGGSATAGGTGWLAPDHTINSTDRWLPTGDPEQAAPPVHQPSTAEDRRIDHRLGPKRKEHWRAGFSGRLDGGS